MRNQSQINESIRKTHILLQKTLCKNKKCKYYNGIYRFNCSIVNTIVGEKCLGLPRKERKGYDIQ